jgi:hypothetical protein
MQTAQAAASFASLPEALALSIFTLVPAETRLRCREVCKPWRDGALKDGSAAWAHLVLRTDHEEPDPEVDDSSLLRAAAARAHGALEVLDVRRCEYMSDVLLQVVAANAATLRELHTSFLWLVDNNKAEALLHAAPLLRVLHTDVGCAPSQYRRVLHNEAPFVPLRLRHLHVDNDPPKQTLHSRRWR